MILIKDDEMINEIDIRGLNEKEKKRSERNLAD